MGPHTPEAALEHLDEIAALARDRRLAVFLDDVTDEDALRALAGRGLGIVVLDQPRPTAAQYRLRDPDQVRVFLEALAETCERRL